MSKKEINAEYMNRVHSIPFDSLGDIGLTDKEVSVFEKYRDLIEPYLIGYVAKPLLLSPEEHPLRKVAEMLLSLDSCLVYGDKEKFVKEVFSPANMYKMTETKVETGFTYLPSPTRGSQHEDILFNLELLHFFVLNRLNIELPDASLPSGKEPEFGVRKDSFFFHLEAKKLNRPTLPSEIFGDSFELLRTGKVKADGSVSTIILSEKQQREIREQFKKLLEKARGKFIGCNDDYVIAMDVGRPLSWLGNKINTYINGNKYFTSDKFLGVLFKLYHTGEAPFCFHENPNLENNPFKSMMEIVKFSF